MEKQELINKLAGYAAEYGSRLLLALLTLIIGLWIVKIFSRFVRKVAERHTMDPSLSGFLISLLSITLKLLLVISVASMVGIQMTSFIAVLGAAGLAVGMAFSGTLQNFAGGVMILTFRPFKVGDFIEAQGYSGIVKEIQVFITVLTSPDNKTIVLPNGSLSSGSLINYSTESTRRVDFTFGIGYEDDIDLAKRLIIDITGADSRVFNDPEPFVAVSELADSSVNLVTRVWVASENYWDVYFETLEAVKKKFDQNGISIPYPQQDVHVHGIESSAKAATAKSP